MIRHNLNEQPEEIRKKIEPILEELVRNQQDRKLLHERNEKLRGELLNTLDVMGLKAQHTMESSGLDIKVKIMQKSSRRIIRERLEKLGVSPEILDKATEVKAGKKHLRIGPWQYQFKSPSFTKWG